jgi:sortase B
MSRREKNKSKSPILTLLILVCLGVFLFSGYKLVSIYLEYKAGTDEYEELREFTSEEADEKKSPDSAKVKQPGIQAEKAGVPLQVDFTKLKKINPDIVGWIYVGALDISYPIVQGRDNDYYLHRTFRQKDNFSGSIFMEARNKKDFSDPHTIIYGHNMKNGSMFGMLKHLTTENRYQEDPYFWILTPEGNYCYQMFSIKSTKVSSEVYTLFTGTDQRFVDFANRMKSESSVDLGSPSFTTGSKIVTLSTCTIDDTQRFVVQGVRI